MKKKDPYSKTCSLSSLNALNHSKKIKSKSLKNTQKNCPQKMNNYPNKFSKFKFKFSSWQFKVWRSSGLIYNTSIWIFTKFLIELILQDDEDVNSLPSSTGATVGGDVTGAEADERILYLQRRTDRNSRLQARLQVITFLTSVAFIKLVPKHLLRRDIF